VIPVANITAWRRHAPWAEDRLVEQDLVLSRALVEMFSHPVVAERAAFRGGTALHKLFFEPRGRYSEDIDLVQREPGPIGPLVDAIREVLDPWLGEPGWNAGGDRFRLQYRFETTSAPVVRMRVKIEINTREHFAVHGFATRTLAVDNPWFGGTAEVVTYSLSELLATKLRALYQRRKGRDLFDLWLGLQHPEADPGPILDAFGRYTAFGGTSITRAQFDANLAAKMSDDVFLGDLRPLVRTGVAYQPEVAFELVHRMLVARLAGEPWKGGSGPI